MSKCSFSIAMALAIGCSTTNAQSWCPPGARWVYDTGSPWGASWDSYYFAGDTVVGGFNAQRIDAEVLITNFWGTDTLIQSHTANAAITRHTADAVMLWNATSTEWDTLYWFGAQVGDSWRAPWAFAEECPPDHRFTVLETGTMEQDGVVLRKLHVQRTGSDPDGFYPAEWIAERIGTLEGYFFPIGYCGSIFECYCTLMCYSDDQIGYNADPRGCDLPLGVAALPEASAFGLWPNPGSDRVNYTLPVSGRVDVIVADGLGRMVHQARSVAASGTVTMGMVPAGTYFISFSGPEGFRMTRMWQKME